MENRKKALKGALLIKCTGEQPVENSLILIDGNKIVYAGENDSNRDLSEYKVIDVKGKTIIPGMTEAHIHLGGNTNPDPIEWLCEENSYNAIIAATQAQTVLEYGFTSARDISRFSVDLKKAINNGHIKGPRIFATGRGLCRTGGHGDWPVLPVELVEARHPWATIADTIDDCRKTVRNLIRTGVDGIKAFPTGGGMHDMDKEMDTHYTLEEMQAIVEEAALYGKQVYAHAEGLAGVKVALKAGCRSIEHGEELDDECIEFMVKNNVFLIPTLSVIERCFTCFEPPYRGPVVDSFPGANLTEKELNRMYDNFRRCKEAGVKIAVGSDSFASSLTPYGADGLREIQLFVKGGFTEMEALTAAAKTGAELLGFDDITGTVEEGKMADLVVLSENPLEDIQKLCKENIVSVIKEGKIAAGAL